MADAVRPPSTGSFPLDIDYLHAIWQALQNISIGGGSAAVASRPQITIAANGTSVSDNRLLNIPINKIAFVLRGSAVSNIGTTAPVIGTLQFTTGTGTLVASADEPFGIGEIITVTILV